MRVHRAPFVAAALALLLTSLPLNAQSATGAPGIDLELYNPANGTNAFAVEVGEVFWAHLWLRPGPTTSTCSASCGEVLGGSSRLSSGVIRLSFDTAMLKLVDAELNGNRLDAAGEGSLDLRSAGDGALGWTLSGDWSPDGDPSQGALADPCRGLVLEEDDWILKARFQAMGPGESQISIVGQPQFPLSFADFCTSPAFTQGSGIDEIVPATVLVTGAGSGPCVPGATVLCIDDQAGDRRFRVTVSYDTIQGAGASGPAQAVSLAPLGMSQGGLFWFFNRANPEVLVKVLDGCGVNGFFWVFFSAGTNVGLDVSVTDTLTDETWELQNPDGKIAPPSADIQAFPCP